MGAKLLHERLKAPAADDDVVKISDDIDALIFGWEAKILADEIERCYIPLPCDQEGNPWKRGDECIGEYGEGIVEGYDGDGGVYVEFFSDDGIQEGFYDTWAIERPTPKVLDADGVEIKVGDMLYHRTSGTKYEVIDLDPKDEGHALLKKVSLNETNWPNWHALTAFTHREPDSLEKLRDDINAWTERNDHFRCHTGKVTDGWADRITALIERGA